MNISEANSFLVGWFMKNDSITNENFISISPKKTNPLEAEAAFTYALENWTSKNIVFKFVKISEDGKEISSWILHKPLILHSQFVEISGETALAISSTANKFFSQIGDKESSSFALSITENDIKVLLEIINILAENQEQNTQEKNNIK